MRRFLVMPIDEEGVPSQDSAEARDKQAFIRLFEQLILSGSYKPGDRIPAERALAKEHHISRPIIHEGLLDLARKGLVHISPRRGTFVNDYRKQGSPELLASLFNLSEGKLATHTYNSLNEFKQLFEVEAVRKAVERHTEADLIYLDALLKEEKELLASMAEGDSPFFPAAGADLDFRFHLALMLASGNDVYPMLYNTIKKVSLAILERYFKVPERVAVVFGPHAKLVEAIRSGDKAAAEGLIRDILSNNPDGNKDAS
jgi:DNA-binding FadR family transcriptional regulator